MWSALGVLCPVRDKESVSNYRHVQTHLPRVISVCAKVTWLSATPRSVLGITLFSVFLTCFWISVPSYTKAVPPPRTLGRSIRFMHVPQVYVYMCLYGSV